VPAGNLQPNELLQRAADFFDREGIAYRIVGSMASIAYGEPRFTNDIDILVELSLEQSETLCQAFPAPDFYVSLSAVQDAIRRRHQFNIIHLGSGLKVDVILRKETEFSRADISHGRRLKSEGAYDAWFASPENVILMKLRYYQEGGSEKHLRDIASILLTQGSTIDCRYIDSWSETLAVSVEWQLVCEQLKDLK